MHTATILVTGSKGQLGSEIRQLSESYPQFRFVFADREEMPIEDPAAVGELFRLEKPDYCINCAAYTAVDKAETDKAVAMQVNADAVGLLASACRNTGARFMHISTDYVFNGMAVAPYKEDAPTDPVNYYGLTKLAGEQQAIQRNPETLVIRTSWVYSVFGNNFVKTMLRLMKERPGINVVEDQVGSPTYAADLAEAILHIIRSAQWVPGIYHYSNDGVISWYQFADAIRAITGSGCKVNPIPTSSYPTPAKRPAYSVLSKDKIQTTFSISLKPWQLSLEKALSRMK